MTARPHRSQKTEAVGQAVGVPDIDHHQHAVAPSKHVLRASAWMRSRVNEKCPHTHTHTHTITHTQSHTHKHTHNHTAYLKLNLNVKPKFEPQIINPKLF